MNYKLVTGGLQLLLDIKYLYGSQSIQSVCNGLLRDVIAGLDPEVLPIVEIPGRGPALDLSSVGGTLKDALIPKGLERQGRKKNQKDFLYS